jgi:hypothetical protein
MMEEQIIGGKRKMHKEKLCNLYIQPNNIKWIKQVRMRVAWDVGRV